MISVGGYCRPTLATQMSLCKQILKLTYLRFGSIPIPEFLPGRLLVTDSELERLNMDVMTSRWLLKTITQNHVIIAISPILRVRLKLEEHLSPSNTSKYYM